MNKLLKACSRCGKFHTLGERCYKNTNQYYKGDAEIRKFRNSAEWKAKTAEIRQRDKQLCKICMINNIFNYKNLSIHHITPLQEDWSKRLDNSNLITVCDVCHKLCESGKISREKQRQAICEAI